MSGASGAFLEILDEKLTLLGPVTRYIYYYCLVYDRPFTRYMDNHSE